MKTKLLSLLVVAGLVAGGIGAAVAPSAEAANNGRQGVGAVGLVAAAVGVQTGDIDVLNSSLNNVHVIENVLNQNDVDVTVIDGDVTVQDVLDLCNDNPGNCVLSGITLSIDDVNVIVSDIVAIVQVLGGGALVII